MERTAPSLTGRGFARPRNLSPRSDEALVRRPAAERDGLPLLIEAQAPACPWPTGFASRASPCTTT